MVDDIVRGMRLGFSLSVGLYIISLAGLSGALSGCDPVPPAKAASGEQIKSVSFEESFPLSDAVKEASIHGARLEKAVVLMDKHGVLALDGGYRARGVLDKSTLTMVVTPAAGPPRRVSFRSCGHEGLCRFLAEASAAGILELAPLVCRDPIPCEKAP